MTAADARASLERVGYRLRLAVGAALAEAGAAGRDRYDVATAMSRETGGDVTKNMVDRWAAPANEMHRLPAELLPALVSATGDRRPLELIAAACGCAVVDPGELRLAAIGRAYAAKVAADVRLREVLGGGIREGDATWREVLADAGMDS